MTQRPFVSPLLAQQQIQPQPPAHAPVVSHQHEAPPWADSAPTWAAPIIRHLQQEEEEREKPLYDAPPWVTPEWLHPPVGAPEIWCDQCDCVIASRETAVELFVGKVGRNWKNGLPMVVTDKGVAADMRLFVVHIDCVELWSLEIFGPREVIGNACYSCGCEIEPLCEDCDARYKKDME